MTIQSLIDLPEDYTKVLLRIRDYGEEDVVGLAERLDMNQARLAHIIKALKHKGLILVSSATYEDACIRLSVKGQKLTNYLNPNDTRTPMYIQLLWYG